MLHMYSAINQYHSLHKQIIEILALYKSLLLKTLLYPRPLYTHKYVAKGYC